MSIVVSSHNAVSVSYLRVQIDPPFIQSIVNFRSQLVVASELQRCYWPVLPLESLWLEV